MRTDADVERAADDSSSSRDAIMVARPAVDVGQGTVAKPRIPEMVPIPGGAFSMGSNDDPSETPIHHVDIRPFALGRFPVTVGEWKDCVAAGKCADIALGPDDHPMANVSFQDTQDYVAWLSQHTGKAYRLPSEAEWEYAARGGRRTRFWWGDQMQAGMAGCGGCNESGAAQRVKVGSFRANPFSLFDMGGGVDQWVSDGWHKNYHGAPADNTPWLADGSHVHVIRSGSWKSEPRYVRAASRDNYDGRFRYPTLGFRVASSM
ncbi:formylglycine-generating enzyme family protein [Bradyrhizobium ontarionense]|uniref:Formylglycine-generating enzyme family protein n=1 Tax=Bradyrhizobium ontarionense TaxID=2898149 RepID=A0ABY3R6A1_9BRAD|nr:formylglycine-generating enzyme family protein [Bradyrhizobium sp. A19]UFZ02674.1 formylglycine-generating enzyme family protein [Bradyrhizobium sp. A19]